MKYTCCLLLSIFLFLQGVQAQDFNYDPSAKIDQSLDAQVKWGYYIAFNTKAEMVYFKSPGNHSLNYATYHYGEQYWIFWNKSEFDTSAIDLAKLYQSIDLSKTNLQRREPTTNTVFGYVNKENQAYNYSNDPAFKDFINYVREVNGPASYFIKAANNPAKRGAEKEYSLKYSDVEAGIQQGIVTCDISSTCAGERKTTGGMQYYFSLHESHFTPGNDHAYNAFVNNGSVPLVILEIDPSGRMKGEPGLRGPRLATQVEETMERFCKKDFSVETVQAELNYGQLQQRRGTSKLGHFNDVLTKLRSEANINQEALVLYYFTDTERLRKYDYNLSHPVQHGAYGADWDNMQETIIHELGHAMGLRHHFSGNKHSHNLKSHISPACVMNYEHDAPYFCVLCRYALRVDK